MYDLQNQYSSTGYSAYGNGAGNRNNSVNKPNIGADMGMNYSQNIQGGMLPPVPPGSSVGVGGTVMKVVHPYDATLQDELSLAVGTDILVMKEFDDGWAQGMNPKTGVQGAFPMICVAKPEETSAKQNKIDRAFSKRMSSMSTVSAGLVGSQMSNGNPNGIALRIVFPYQGLQEDELTLQPGNDVILIKEFDDGWALGMQPLTGQKGAFPMACVAKPDDVERRRSERFSKDRLSKRMSSIAW